MSRSRLRAVFAAGCVPAPTTLSRRVWSSADRTKTLSSESPPVPARRGLDTPVSVLASRRFVQPSLGALIFTHKSAIIVRAPDHDLWSLGPRISSFRRLSRMTPTPSALSTDGGHIDPADWPSRPGRRVRIQARPALTLYRRGTQPKAERHGRRGNHPYPQGLPARSHPHPHHSEGPPAQVSHGKGHPRGRLPERGRCVRVESAV